MLFSPATTQETETETDRDFRATTRGEKSAYFKCCIVGFVPVTDTISRSDGIALSKRLFTPEMGRTRGNFMNTRVV